MEKLAGQHKAQRLWKDGSMRGIQKPESRIYFFRLLASEFLSTLFNPDSEVGTIVLRKIV
jgi:hypothetical protein